MHSARLISRRGCERGKVPSTMIRTTLQVATITWGAGGRVSVGTTPRYRLCVNTQRPSTHPASFVSLSLAPTRRHHSRTTSLPPGTQSLCYPRDTSDRPVGHANGIVAPLWKLCGRARLQFAPCQLYLRIGSHDDITRVLTPRLDEARAAERDSSFSDFAGILSADPHHNDAPRSFPPMCA